MAENQVPSGWASLIGRLDTSQAALLAELLMSEGVTVIKRDDPSGGLYGLYGLGNVSQELLVRSDERARAVDVLRQWDEAEPIYPDDLADT